MGKKRKSNYFSETLYRNSGTYNFWLYRMLEIYFALFKWKMPDSIDIRTLNSSLLFNGFVCFYKEERFTEGKQYIAMPCTMGGNINIYTYPTEYEIISPNGYTAHRTIDDSVIIYNNYLHSVPYNAITLFAQRLTNAQIAADININNQKTPKIYKCSEEQKLSLQNYLKQYQGGIPIIQVTKENDFTENMVFDTAVPYVADKMHIAMNNIWNDFLSYCGIENSNNEKRERLVSAETQANYGQIEASRNTMLMGREEGCDKIRKMFGLSESECGVEFNSKLPTTINFPNLYVQTQTGSMKESERMEDNIKTDNFQNENNETV